MTTPKRYEEMARAWLTKKYGRIDSFNYQGGPTSADADDLEEVISTAAKEAQLRVLDRALNIASRADSQSDARDLLTTLRARVERGEDV